MVDRFYEQARSRWLQGRRERGLDLDAPFESDTGAAHEFAEEILDAVNYLTEMQRSQVIGEEVARRAHQMLYELHSMAMLAKAEAD